MHFLFYSVDNLNEYELAPIASFHPKLKEARRFYSLYPPNDAQQPVNDDVVDLDNMPFTLMQGVFDDDSIALKLLCNFLLLFSSSHESYMPIVSGSLSGDIFCA